MREPHVELYIHLVWGTWNRLPLITIEREPQLFACLITEGKKLRAEVVAVNAVSDHVHTLVQMHATTELSMLVKQMKGASSHLMTQLDPETFFKWQGAYGAFSVSRWDVSRVSTYVHRQKEHHRVGTLSQLLELP